MRRDPFRSPAAEINVTPLVDVMLVLLTIFMVTAPLLQQGIEINLPKAMTGRHLSESDLVITLMKDHSVYFNGEAVSLKQLRQKLSGLKNGQPILIRADRQAQVNKLVELWDLCRDSGFYQVHITTSTEQKN